MVDYDSLARNRPPAEVLRQRILRQVSRGRSPYDGRLPEASELDALVEEWLPERTLQSGVKEEERSWKELTRHRQTSDYWRGHCELVGTMMERLARQLGEDERLWRTAGLVHDLDFLLEPHYLESTDPDKAHPNAICAELLEMGLPPVLVLAVLEHSPHLRLLSTSPMSHALILCDEHATMTGAGQAPDFDGEAPAELVACLLPAAPIAGFTRDDMRFRAGRAMAPLAALYQEGRGASAGAEFDAAGWAP